MKKSIIFIGFIVLIIAFFGFNGERENVRFSPDRKAPSITNTENTVKKSDSAQTEAVKLKISSLTNNELETNVPYHVIRGTAPTGADKIVINDYTLTKYRPGDKQWSYIAAENMGTLKKGKNSYTVVAFNSAGEVVDSETFKITYNPSPAPTLPTTGNDAWFALLLTFIASASYIYAKKWKLA